MKIKDLILLNNDMLVKEPFVHPNHVDKPMLAGTPAMKKSDKEMAQGMANAVMTGLEVVKVGEELIQSFGTGIEVGDYVLPEAEIQSFTYVFEDGGVDALGKQQSYLKLSRNEVWAVVKAKDVTETTFKKSILVEVKEKKY
jgi:hypothetical protein